MHDATKRTLLWTAAGCGAYLFGRTLVSYSRKYDFADRTVIVTGGSRGLGLVIARQLASEGARVAICARDEHELDRALVDLLNYGPHIFAGTCDITDPQQVSNFVEDVRLQFGPVDVLINNAGIIQVGPVETMTQADYEAAMDMHFWAPLRMIHHVLPDMRKRRQGRIVNISSIGGKLAVPHLGPYSASKFALVGLSQGLRSELTKDNIYVTTVSPGMMRTGSPRNAWFKGRHREEYTWFTLTAATPLVSLSAERAASKILEACRYGQADITLSTSAKLAARLNILAPNLTADLLSLANRLLPAPGGIGTE